VAERFAENLRSARRGVGITQEELSFRAALHRTEVGLLERAARVPRIDTLIKLSNALGVEAQELLAGLKWKPGELQPGAFEIKSNAEIQKAENPNSNHPHALSLQK